MNLPPGIHNRDFCMLRLPRARPDIPSFEVATQVHTPSYHILIYLDAAERLLCATDVDDLSNPPRVPSEESQECKHYRLSSEESQECKHYM